MIPDIIAFTLEHPIFTGAWIGAGLAGGPLGVLGWLLGYEAAMRKASGWMREKRSDVSTLPPVRERRLSSVAHRELLS